MDVVTEGRWSREGRLWIDMPGEVAQPRRVVPVGKPHLAEIGGRRQRALLVSDVDRTGAGTIVVPIAELVDAAPLSRGEVARYAQLDSDLAGQARVDQRKWREFMGLLHRWQMFGAAAS